MLAVRITAATVKTERHLEIDAPIRYAAEKSPPEKGFYLPNMVTPALQRAVRDSCV